MISVEGAYLWILSSKLFFLASSILSEHNIGIMTEIFSKSCLASNSKRNELFKIDRKVVGYSFD